MEPLYSAAKTVFTPWLRFGLRWTMDGLDHLPTDGPVILASNHVSYLDPLTLAWVADRRGRHVRFLAKAELFRKPVLGFLLRAIHQIPVDRGTADASHALDAACDALGRGECVAVFPEGTISTSLEPMPGKSGTARLAHATGAPIVPVGLWGTHRLLTKHRPRHWQWGIAQVAIVGPPITVAAGASLRATTRQVDAAIRACVEAAWAAYPDRPGPGDDPWWWRAPSGDRAAEHAG